MALKNLTRDSFKWTNGRGHDQKPILYSVKNNSLGLGKSLHVAQTDNWWERAFDNSLKSLSVSKTQDGGIKVVQEEVKGGGVGLKQVVVMGKGSYADRIKFVRGGLLEGTLRELKAEVVERVAGEDVAVKAISEVKKVEGGKKRKREGDGVAREEKEEARDKRRKRRKEEKAAKELRRLARGVKKEKKARKAQEKEKKARKAQEKEEKGKLKSESKSKSSKSEGEGETVTSTTI
ncbi:hypothetical protein EV426DRAFT_411492 [Tirmania nivea]|nr:hypothetical protein EV426DRAFT_411492 [Tirmania nivea]